jgi:hypothetical protein
MNNVNEKSTKVWYNAIEIVNLMSISRTTYKRRLNTFKPTELYRTLARHELIQNKKGNDTKKYRLIIHREAVARYFGIMRNYKHKKPSITQMLKVDWNLIGNFRIKTNDPDDYHHRIDFLISTLDKNNPKTKISVAYSLERDKDGLHCHLLLKHSSYEKNKNVIEDTFKLICEPTRFNLFRKDYDEKFGDSGILYSLKTADLKAIHYKTN